MLKILCGLFLAAMILTPLTANAQSKNFSINGDHGKLSAVLQTPDDKKNFPLVIICHGFTGNKNEKLLTTLADNLETRGIASIRFDFNGHGESEGDFQDMTVLNEIEDAKKVISYAKNLNGVTSVSLAGHSQGGVVASMTAGELGAKEIKSLVLLAPAAVLRDDAIRGILMGFQYDSMNLPEYVTIYDGKKVGRNYFRIAQTLPIYETAEKFTGKAFMIHGTGDVIVPYTYSLSYKKVLKNSEVEILEGFDHGFNQDVEKTAKLAAEWFAKNI